MKSKKILTLTPYACGRIQFSKKDYKDKSFINPLNSELVFRIEHKQFGNILFNSGYSRLLHKKSPKILLFLKGNKLIYTKGEEITAQLENEGMDELCIKKIILSHAAVDSIAGLNLFSNYTLISTAQALTRLDHSLFGEYIPKCMIPDTSIPRKAVALYQKKTFLENYFRYIYDILGDGSVLGVSLDGHSKGHIGLFLPEWNILLGGSACTDSINLHSEPSGNFLSRQYDEEKYLATLNNLRRFLSENPNVHCIFSHDTLDYAIEQIRKEEKVPLKEVGLEFV